MIKLIQKYFDKTFFKFVLVGVINTLFGTTIMFVFYNVFHFNYWMSSSANYFFGSILSYLLNKNFTFSNKEQGLKPMLKFIINIVVCYTIAYGIAQPLVYNLLSDYTNVILDNIAMVTGMTLFVFLNYFGQRFFAFK